MQNGVDGEVCILGSGAAHLAVNTDIDWGVWSWPWQLLTMEKAYGPLRDFRLLPRCKWVLRSFGVLRSVDWWFRTKSGPLDPSIWDPIGYPETSIQTTILGCVKSQRIADPERTFFVISNRMHSSCKYTWLKCSRVLCLWDNSFFL
jgi:hypothetical protein